MQPDLSRERLDELVRICVKAGEAILEVYAGDIEVHEKSDQSPLTQADLASHHIICDALEQLDPDIPVLSEESAHIPFDERSSWRSYWLVDPLDGTREFVNRNGEFTVNIALIHDHVPVMGVVYVPVTGTSYFGARSLGAFKRSAGEVRAIGVRKPAPRTLVVVGSRSHANPELEQQLDAIGPFELVSMGSSLKFCLVAEGEADFYPRLGPTSEWDTGAAQAVVEAAGGQVVKLDGKALRYNTRSELLNPHFLVFGDDQKDWSGLILGDKAGI
jgi:3'(2'), 5'-bisphosphate nucleotidase